jgi:tetratricopeptide (TPR) repeat protein
VGEAEKSALLEVLLDLDMSEGRRRAYAEEYATLALKAETEDRRRQLDVKAHLARTGAGRKMFDILSLRPGSRAVKPAVAALTIQAEAEAKPDDPIRAYLLSRQYFNAEDFDDALAILSKAESIGLFDAPPTVRTAARLMKGESLLSLKRYDDAVTVFRAVASDPAVREGIRATAEDWADRATFLKTQPQ